MSGDFFTDFITVIIYFVCIIFMISALDDLAIDLFYIYIRVREKDDWKVTLEDLQKPPEKRIALFVPAWQESEVITEMVTHNLANIEYKNYDFFIGVYPNDKPTVKKTNRLVRKYPGVYKSEVPHPGPTCKADCLNWLYQKMKLVEETENKIYDIIIMHDSEDIIHPQSFKLVNYLMPRYKMVQIPVFSLEVPWNYFTAGTYCDEFAEHHIKNLAVREQLNGFIPSAGVGTAFSRTALDTIAESKRNMIFNTDSLTEDYEIGLKFSQFNFKQILPRRAIRIKRQWNGFTASLIPTFIKKVFSHKNEFIATREYFPNQAKAAIKQKSRWILGIIFQGWEQIRWNASGINRIFLYIDRKGIYSNLASFLANLLFFFGLFYIAAYYIFGLQQGLERFFPPSGFVWYVIIFNTFVMFERISIKVYASSTLYGFRFALLSILRIPWLNFINFFAMARAIYRYTYHKYTGTRMTWDKTQHIFPDRDVMKVYRKRLGELLLENRIISQTQLEKALSIQQKEGLRLGEILVRMDLVTEKSLGELLSTQYNLEINNKVDFDASLVSKVPSDILALFEAIPVSLEDSVLTLGVREPLNEETVENIELATHYDVRQQVLPNGEYYRLKDLIKLPVRLGLHLVINGHLKGDDVLDAMMEQRDSGEPLGDILVENDMISPDILSREFKALFGLGFLLKVQDYTEVETLDWGKENHNIPGYVLKDSKDNKKDNKIYVSRHLPHEDIKRQMLEKYSNIQFKALFKKDEGKWKIITGSSSPS